MTVDWICFNFKYTWNISSNHLQRSRLQWPTFNATKKPYDCSLRRMIADEVFVENAQLKKFLFYSQNKNAGLLPFAFNQLAN